MCVVGVHVWGLYPAAAATSLLLLLLFDELHGRGWGRGRSHGPDHLDAVLRQRGQVQMLPASHLHLLELLETAQGELEDKDGGRNTVIHRLLCSESMSGESGGTERRWMYRHQPTYYYIKDI